MNQKEEIVGLLETLAISLGRSPDRNDRGLAMILNMAIGLYVLGRCEQARDLVKEICLRELAIKNAKNN